MKRAATPLLLALVAGSLLPLVVELHCAMLGVVLGGGVNGGASGGASDQPLSLSHLAGVSSCAGPALALLALALNALVGRLAGGSSGGGGRGGGGGEDDAAAAGVGGRGVACWGLTVRLETYEESTDRASDEEPRSPPGEGVGSASSSPYRRRRRRTPAVPKRFSDGCRSDPPGTAERRWAETTRWRRAEGVDRVLLSLCPHTVFLLSPFICCACVGSSCNTMRLLVTRCVLCNTMRAL